MYSEIAIGGVQFRNKTVLTNKIPELIEKSNYIESYRSYYEYDEEILKHFTIQKTVRGYKGNYYLNHIVLDVDKGKDSNDFVNRRAIEFYERLKDDFKIFPRIYYSGTGYHFEFPSPFNFTPSNILPLIAKETFTKYFPEADAIYDGSRLIRLPNTLNSKSNLYKVQLTQDELFSGYEAIKEIAIKPRLDFVENEDDYSIPDLSSLVEEIVAKPELQVKKQDSKILSCISNIWNDGPSKGTRHDKLLRLASIFRRNGLPRQATYFALKDWADNMEEYEVKRFVDNVYDKEYSYGCNDLLLKKFCSESCIYAKNKNFNTSIVDAKTAEEEFIRYMKSDYQTNSFGLQELYNCKDYNFYPEELVLLIADTKMGKSMIIQNICAKLTRLKILHLSLENSQNLTYRRYIQIAHNMSKEQVNEYYQTNNNHLSDAIQHINIMTVSPNLDNLARLISDSNANIVIIDTLDGVIVPGVNDITQKTDIMGNTLKQLAQRMKCIIIGVHHITKSASQDEKGNAKYMTVHSGKGASTLEQKADKILAIEGDRNSNIRVFRSVASRDEGDFKITLEFNPETFVFTQQTLK